MARAEIAEIRGLVLGTLLYANHEEFELDLEGIGTPFKDKSEGATDLFIISLNLSYEIVCKE